MSRGESREAIWFLKSYIPSGSTAPFPVNPVRFDTITVLVTFRDEQGNQFYTTAFTLGPLAHTAFSLSERYPQSKGHRGVVELKTTDFTMNVLGLRFGAASFTSILPMTR